MRVSAPLGTFAGIKVGIHWSIAVIAALFTYTLATTILPDWAPGFGSFNYGLAAVATAGLFLVSIVAHELGHSVVAVRNGIGVSGIVLFALGGVATLEDEPKSPGAAARIALAGPAVSLGIGAASLGVAAGASAVGVPSLFVAGFAWLGLVNLVLAVFNMIPALPLDGGRALQAGLWKWSGDRHKATITAATIGQYLGWAIVAFGIWQVSQGAGGLWTAVIGWFVVSTARRERRAAQFQQLRKTILGHWGFIPNQPTGSGPTDFNQPNRTNAEVIDVDGHEVARDPEPIER